MDTSEGGKRNFDAWGLETGISQKEEQEVMLTWSVPMAWGGVKGVVSREDQRGNKTGASRMGDVASYRKSRGILSNKKKKRTR